MRSSLEAERLRPAERRFVPNEFYRFYHRSVKFACPDLNGLCPRPSIYKAERTGGYGENENAKGIRT